MERSVAVLGAGVAETIFSGLYCRLRLILDRAR